MATISANTLVDTARKHGICKHIRFGSHVCSADWDSHTDTWTVWVDGETYRSRFIFFGTGYYNYDEGYTPGFPGIERFTGDVVHPQHWPEGLDYTGKTMVVIGSGATAISLIPALAGRAGKVFMLQRSPSYVLSSPRVDPVINAHMLDDVPNLFWCIGYTSAHPHLGGGPMPEKPSWDIAAGYVLRNLHAAEVRHEAAVERAAELTPISAPGSWLQPIYDPVAEFAEHSRSRRSHLHRSRRSHLHHELPVNRRASPIR